MDIAAVITRAEDAAARGDLRAAITGLKAAIEFDPRAEEPRLALARVYRAAGYPDQAGRWGLQTEGWTTVAERNAFGRSLGIRRNDPRPRIRELLILPLDQDLTDDAERIVSGHRARERRPVAHAVRGAVGWISASLWGIAVVVFALGLLTVFAQALAGAESVAATARGLGVIAGSIAALAAIATGVYAITSRWAPEP